MEFSSLKLNTKGWDTLVCLLQSRLVSQHGFFFKVSCCFNQTISSVQFFFGHFTYLIHVCLLQIPVRPYRHNEYERFITSAYPYYTASFSTVRSASKWSSAYYTASPALTQPLIFYNFMSRSVKFSCVECIIGSICRYSHALDQLHLSPAYTTSSLQMGAFFIFSFVYLYHKQRTYGRAQVAGGRCDPEICGASMSQLLPGAIFTEPYFCSANLDNI